MLRNAPIRSRFVFTLIVPLLGLAVLAVGGIRSDLVVSARAARVHQLARFGADLEPVIYELQDERSLSGNHLAVGRRAGAAELAGERRAVDRVVAAFRAAAGRLGLGRDQAAVRHKIDAVMGALGKLPIQRRTIDTSPITPADERVRPLIAPQERGEPPARASEVPNRLSTPREALDQYTLTISALIQLNTEIAPGTDNKRLLDGIDAWISLSRATDFVDLQRALLYKVFAQRGFFGGAEHGRLVALNAAEDIDMAQFAGFATPAQRELLRQEVGGPDIDRAETFKRMALLQEQLHRIEVDPRVWYASASVKLDRLRQVERRLGADVIAASATLEANADRRALLYGVLLAATVVLAIGLSLVTARSLIVPLGRLKEAADEVAQRKLPGVVRRLQDGAVVDLATEAAGPVQVGSTDEIGQLAEAFNSVHQVAVQLAGKQAALRRSIGDMFLNLARRSQSLIDRQLEVIGVLPDAEAAELPVHTQSSAGSSQGRSTSCGAGTNRPGREQLAGGQHERLGRREPELLVVGPVGVQPALVAIGAQLQEEPDGLGREPAAPGHASWCRASSMPRTNVG